MVMKCSNKSEKIILELDASFRVPLSVRKKWSRDDLMISHFKETGNRSFMTHGKESDHHKKYCVAIFYVK